MTIDCVMAKILSVRRAHLVAGQSKLLVEEKKNYLLFLLK